MFLPVTSIDHIKVGSTILINDGIGAPFEAPVEAIINPQYGQEVIFNTEENRYFNFKMFKEGSSWVKELSVKITSENKHRILIGDSARIVPYAELPLEHQLAIAYYMAINGSAWEFDYDAVSDLDDTSFMQFFKTCIPLFIKKYGSMSFGMTTITSEQAKAALMANPEIAESFATWDEYHAWYLGAQGVPKYTGNMWPVILGAEGDDETFEDGNRRLHSYLRDGHEIIPAVYYID